MHRQPVTDPPEGEDADAPLITAREHSRHTAAYLAAEIAKAAPFGNGESIKSRVAAVMSAADTIFEWLSA